MNAPLTEIDRRAFRHDVVDGLTEIAVALFFLIPAFTVREPAFSWLIILPILFMGRGLQRLRARHTWPRIGYVAPRGESGGEVLRGMLIYTAVAMAVIGAGIFIIRGEMTPGLVRRASPLLAAVLFGGGLLYAFRRSGLPRYAVLFGLSLALGTALTAMEIPGRYLNLQLYLVGMGAVTLAVGLVTFLRFVRSHPVRVIEDGDDER